MRSRSSLFWCAALLIPMHPASGFDGTGSLVSQGVTRSFVYFHPGAAVQPGRPLLIALHGTGGSGPAFKSYSGFDAVATDHAMTVVYPNSTTIGGDAQWNVYADDQPGHGGVGVPTATDDVQFIADLIDHFCALHAIDPMRVYATGHSNGGFMVYQLALHLPHRIAAFAPVAASLWGDSNYLAARFSSSFVPVPIEHVHGDPDPIVTYPDPDHDPATWNWPLSSFGDATCGNPGYTTSTLAPTVQLLTFCDGGMGAPVRLTRVTGVGHAWPNASGYNVAQAIGAFCMMHTLAGAVCGTGIAAADDRPSYTVHPVPATDQLWISPPLAPGSVMRVTDLSGRVLHAGGSMGTAGLHLHGWEPGPYVLHIRCRDGSTQAHPFLVTR